MSDDARDPSPDNGASDEAKAAATPREPTEIVVYRAGPEAGAGAGWHAARDGFGPTPEPRRGWGGRVAALVAVAALIGAVGGSLAATKFGSALSSGTTQAQAASADELKSAREAIARLEKDLASLKADAEKTAKARTAQVSAQVTAQVGKLGERLDKAEKAQDEQAAKLAKLVEAQDKERKSAAAMANAAADVTGSVPKPAARESDRPQVVAGWRLNRIVPGGAEVESGGVRYAVYPGDPLPGVGTVAGLKRGEDGRWAVVTSKGLIVGR